MKFVLAILSDIHFSSDSTNSILTRLDQICSAIASTELMPDAIMLLFSGDITNKGRKLEYKVAGQFVCDLKDKLKSRLPSAEIFTISVPGNHDLELPDDSDDFRKKVVEGCSDSILLPAKNQFYLQKLLEPQANYWAFAGDLDFHPQDVNSKICGSFTVKLKDRAVRFNLINSALLSKKREAQGSLLLPLPIVHEVLEQSSTELTITVMHHPTFWIESNTLTELRDVLAQTTDYLITGHQHVSSVYDVKTELGENIRYYESPALFDPLRAGSSGFRVLVFDLAQDREKQMLFTWDAPIYKTRRTSEFGWKEISETRQIRQSMTMNPAAVQFLNDPGFASPRGNRRAVKLQELFVYPDLKIQKDLDLKQAQIKKGPDLVAFLTEGGTKEIHGAPLSGKTTLSKALALDIRARGIATTLWIDGKDLNCSTPDDFEKYVHSAFRQLYSVSQLEAYLQLHSDQRCIIIDDWHLADIRTPVRNRIYDWLTAFAKATVLMVDETYRFKELLAKGQATKALSDPAVRGIVHGYIVRLSRVGQATLIQNYMRISNEADDLIEESNELLKIEKLVSELLGKDWLPVFPFFVLGILQVIETKRTAAIAGGSHGPLYEAIIYSALLKENRDDPQVANKIAFLQEIAYRMWSKKMTAISLSEIQSVVDEFYEASYLRLPTLQFLEALSSARILTRSDANYTFAYPQYFYYFVALYLSEHMDDPGAGSLQTQVDRMVDEISSVENSAIVMLLIYLGKDKNHIIGRLLNNTRKIYSSVLPAKMEGDAADFANLRSVQLNFELDDPPDVAGNRHRVRLFQDEKDEGRLLDAKAELEVNSLAAYSYSDELPENCKQHLVSQSIKTLGQVIRNFSANLSGPRKVEVLKETYLLTLRAIARMLDLFKSVRTSMDKFQPPDDSQMSFLEFRRMADEFFTLLMQGYVVVMCQSVSDNVGISDMDKAYIEAAEQLGKSIAIRFIDLTVQLNHFAGIPESAIRDLHEDLRGNAFSSQILNLIVITHLMLHKVNTGTFNRIRKALGLNRNELPMPKDSELPS